MKDTTLKFNEFKKLLKGIKFKVVKEWNITLPHHTPRETIQNILDLCRENMLLDWHVIYPEPTGKDPEPEIKIYWDRK